MRTSKPSLVHVAIAVCSLLPLILFLGFRESGDGTARSRWRLSAQNTGDKEVDRAGNRTLGVHRLSPFAIWTDIKLNFWIV